MAARKTATAKKKAEPKKPAAKKPAARARKPKPAPKGPPKVVDAVKRDLAAIARRDKQLAECGLAAAALALARELDSPRNSATSKSMCARALRETLDRLSELAPEEQQEDRLDDLSARRAKRIAGRSAS